MTDGIIQKTFKSHKRYFGQDYDIDQSRLKQEIIEELKKILQNEITETRLNKIIGDNEK